MSTKKHSNKPYEVTYTAEGQFMYQQVPQAGKTTAVLGCTLNNFVDVADKILDKINPKYLDLSGNAIDFMLEYAYMATAKVHKECGDVWDAETGKNVAREKALSKFHRDLDVKLRDFLYEARSLVVAIEHYMDKHDVSYEGVLNESTIRETRFKGSK